MKKVLAIVIAMVLMLTLVPAGVVLAKPDGIGDGTVDPDAVGGKHFNLNIIGVKNPKSASMDGGGGVIFVDLEGKNAIYLVQSGTGAAEDVDPLDFAVLDKNATDRDGALLALPDPDLDPYIVGGNMTGVDVESAYSIFVRPLGKPGGKTKITTCANITETFGPWLSKGDFRIINKLGEFGGYASVEQVGHAVTTRTNGQGGKTKFSNVTAELTTIVFKIEILDGPGGAVIETIYVRVPIFDDMLKDEYWEYDNDKLKLLQIRIYPVGTDVSQNDNPPFNNEP